ncbi:MAG: threonine/serine dehydratase [Mycoplasmataceae bacterium]|nr:threonine/serine dehydratase [Mycoplasmataceae bacterium]
MELTLNDIKEAQQNIKSVVKRTDLIYDYSTSQQFGGNVYLKLENTQIVKSFKIRGAANAIAQLSPEQKKAGVITASAGNHAQGVAYSASQLGIKSVIVMPNSTPLNKVDATLGFGGEVVFGPTAYFDDANQLAVEMAKKNNYVYIPPYDHKDVMAGQGTIGIEILEQNPQIDLVICQIGGGGLIAGVATAIKAINPKCEIIGVQTENFPDARDIYKGDKLVTKYKYVPCIADGIQVKQPSLDAMQIVKKYVSDVITVTNEEIQNAILWIAEKCKVVAEGAGATGMAAILSGKIDIKNRNVAVIISGGNIDIDRLISCCSATLTKDKRTTTFSFTNNNETFPIFQKALQTIGGRAYLTNKGIAILANEHLLKEGLIDLMLYAPNAKKTGEFFAILKKHKIDFELKDK